MWPDIPLENGNITWYKEPINPYTGKASSPINITPINITSYDLSKNIDYVLALKSTEVSWRLVVTESDDTPLLSSATPVRYRDSGIVVAVTGVTAALSSISQFLRELTSSHSGYLYLTTADGQLLATSTNASLIDSSGPRRTLVLANESSDPVIKAGAQWLYARHGFEGLVKTVVHAENVVLEGKRYYIDTFSLSLSGLQMVGVIIIPRTYVMGEVDRSGRATLAILIAISCCILFVGCFFIIFFTSGVSTEMKLRAELINHLDARRRAEASSNYKSQFLANMSHELRTPMAAVIGLLDILLCDDCLSSEQINMVSQIRRCSTALLRLLNNILDISKVESGKLVLEAADFDLNRELEGLVDMFSVQCVDHDIEIVLDLAVFLILQLWTDDMPRMVRGDSARIVQIFANLIANSVKFTSSGHVILRGWCSSPNMSATAMRSGLLFGMNDSTWNQNRLSHEGGVTNNYEPSQFLMWFEVEDTGCGIDSSKWEAVFESFVQADPSTTRTYGGTGLGLCIVRSLVRKMGGDIKIVKKEGPGTLLRFYLLFNQPVDSEPETPRPAVPAGLKNTKVLLAMKGDVGRGTLVQWMQYKGLHVYEASEWDEAMRVLQELLADERVVSWDKGADKDELVSLEANHVKSSRSTAASRDANEIPDEELSLVLSGNSKQWEMQDFKLLAVLDSELIHWSEDSNQVDSMFSVLDEFRGRGIIISWLFTHDTPNALKTQLRRRGYTITANQPLYKSKLLQLLTSMAGCSEGGSSTHFKCESQALQAVGSDQRKLGYYDDIKAAAIDRHELEKLQSQVQSKLGFPGSTKSLPRVLEKWPSKELEGVNQGSERFLVTERNPGISADSNPRGVQRSLPLTQQLEEQEFITLSNLGPSASPASSAGGLDTGSPGSRVGSLKTSLLSVDTDLSSSMLPVGNSRDGTDGNHVVHIPPATSHPPDDTYLGSPKYQDVLDQSDQDVTKTQVMSSLFNASEGPLSIGPSVGPPGIEIPQIFCEQDQIAKPDMIVVSDRGVPVQTVSNHTESSRTAQDAPAPKPAVSLPPSEVMPDKHSRAPRKPPARRLGPSNALAGIRILLAEDTPVLAKVATIMLEKMGACVVAVGDGLQAVETIGRSRGEHNVGDTEESTTPAEIDGFDLVLMDCQMPRMDGYEATKAIRKAEEGKNWHLPVVALTAHAMSSDEAKCLQVGMDAYLTKPIDSKLMVSTILGLTKKGTG
ncbi:histidine kinase 1 isoform X3 [Physcomitrium patens]